MITADHTMTEKVRFFRIDNQEFSRSLHSIPQDVLDHLNSLKPETPISISKHHQLVGHACVNKEDYPGQTQVFLDEDKTVASGEYKIRIEEVSVRYPGLELDGTSVKRIGMHQAIILDRVTTKERKTEYHSSVAWLFT